MKHFRGLTFAAISLLAAVSYAEDVVAPDVASDVKVLQTDTFDSFINEHPLVLAECKLTYYLYFSVYHAEKECFTCID